MSYRKYSPQDIKLDTDGDLAIENFDFVSEPCAIQNNKLLLIGNQGDFRFSPLTGVGITKFLNASNDGLVRVQIKKNVREQVERDGSAIETLEVRDNLKIQLTTQFRQ